MKTFYRVEERILPKENEDKEIMERVSIYLDEYTIYSETKKGYWIFQGDPIKKHFISKDNNKKAFAFDNKDDAIQSFLYHKKRQLNTLKLKMYATEMAIELATIKKFN